MAEPLPTIPAPSPAPAATAPVAAAAAIEPAAPSTPPAAEPAPATAPAAQASQPAAAAPTVAKPAEPSPQPAEPAAAVPTLLEKFDKEKSDAEAAKKPAEPAPAKAEAAPAKPAEPAKPGKVPPAKAAEPAAPAPVDYKYTLPETIQMDDTLRGEVHAAFDHFRANPSEGAQELVNLHEKQMRQFAQFMADEQQRIFKETRQKWQKEILADPEIGGSGHQTAMGAIARMRDLFVPEKDRPAFDEFLRVTGAGDNPAFLKAFHNAARFYDEPPLPPPNPRPAGNGQRPSRRLRDVYDHPRSTPEGRNS